MAADTITVDQPKVKPKPRPAVKPKEGSKPQRQPPYNVVLLDDQDHSYEYVIDLCGRLFGMSAQRGFVIAQEVDSTGRAILLTTTKEHAELKRDQVHGLGADWRIKRCRGAMRAIIEPVQE